MNKNMLFLALLCLLPLALAAPTDGNYTLTQWNFTGGGNVTPDNNFASFASAGEPIVIQNTSDDNSALAVGFWGTPFSAILIEEIAAAAEEAARTMFVVLGKNANYVIPLMVVILLASFAIFYMMFKKKLVPKKEEMT